MSPADDERILRKEPVFATALSDNHFDVAHGIMLKTFTEANPSKKIIVYDLGLSTEHVDKVRPGVHFLYPFLDCQPILASKTATNPGDQAIQFFRLPSLCEKSLRVSMEATRLSGRPLAFPF